MGKKLNFVKSSLEGAYVIEPNAFIDHRGFFARNFCFNEFGELNLNNKVVQINHSGTKGKGIIRGLHYQLPPKAETKVIKCVKGRLFDVIVDLRKDSPTFLKWFGIELSEENKKMLYVPKGFAHGFQALTKEVEMIYFVSEYYSPEHEKGVRYDDPLVGVEWKIKDEIITSEKDSNISLLNSNFKGIEL